MQIELGGKNSSASLQLTVNGPNFESRLIPAHAIDCILALNGNAQGQKMTAGVKVKAIIEAKADRR